jgi:hypothetical protein
LNIQHDMVVSRSRSSHLGFGLFCVPPTKHALPRSQASGVAAPHIGFGLLGVLLSLHGTSPARSVEASVGASHLFAGRLVMALSEEAVLLACLVPPRMIRSCFPLKILGRVIKLLLV